ncbi:MAG: hypothetical protein CL936_16220 [Deltaproteobacteria bacterium]|nr:hypothetical protein [Deltaproteobacteria bacterium]
MYAQRHSDLKYFKVLMRPIAVMTRKGGRVQTVKLWSHGTRTEAFGKLGHVWYTDGDHQDRVDLIR